jgi:hypothetical protein
LTVPGLLFEIWQDPDDNSFHLSGISERGDQLRKSISPDAVKVHAFTARSDFEASQKNYDWHGWGRWNPAEGWTEHVFADAEIAEQNRYLAIRDTD